MWSSQFSIIEIWEKCPSRCFLHNLAAQPAPPPISAGLFLRINLARAICGLRFGERRATSDCGPGSPGRQHPQPSTAQRQSTAGEERDERGGARLKGSGLPSCPGKQYHHTHPRTRTSPPAFFGSVYLATIYWSLILAGSIFRQFTLLLRGKETLTRW